MIAASEIIFVRGVALGHEHLQLQEPSGMRFKVNTFSQSIDLNSGGHVPQRHMILLWKNRIRK
jgi:hypothetical protein